MQGLVGRRHAEAISKVDEADISAIIDPDPASRSAATQEGLRAYSDLDAALKDHVTQAVILATPNALHVDQAVHCLEKRIPVLVEKPIATRSADARRIVEAAERTGVPVLVGHHRRYNPIIQRAKTLISGGRLGRLRSVNGQCWLYKPDSYFDAAGWRKKPGAGPVAVNLVHDIDLLRYLCGDIRSVRAMARPALRGYDNEDIAGALLDFADGAIGTISVSDSIASPWSWELTAGENPAYPATGQSCYMLGGSQGSLSLPDLRLWSHVGSEPHWWSPMEVEQLAFSVSDPLVSQIKHFVEVIAGKSEPLVTAAEGMKSLQVVEAIHLAATTGDAEDPNGL